MGLLGNLDELAQYVAQGGYVFQETTPVKGDAFYRLYRKMGIVNAGGSYDAQGVHLTSNVLIGEENLIIKDSFIVNSMMSVELDKKSKVLAKTVEGAPLFYGSIHTVKASSWCLTGQCCREKLNRGVIAGAISMLEPVFVYPIFNSKIVYLDDFPMPIASVIDPIIYNEYHKTRPAFIKDIWWPDMLALAKQSDVKYTGSSDRNLSESRSPSPIRVSARKRFKGTHLVWT